MTRFHITLRLLLCLSLAVNGTSYAAAGVRMQLEHAAVAVAAAAVEAPCHGHETGNAVAAPADQASAGDHSAQAAAMDATHGVPDCCKTSQCAFACAQQAQAAATMEFSGSAVIEHVLVVGTLTAAHPAPPLPHLIRPPIG